MKLRDSRLWAVIIAVAFLALWCAGVCVAYAAPAQEPLPNPAAPVPSQAVQTIGIAGWCLIGVGFLGVALFVAFGSRPKRRKKRVRAVSSVRYPAKVMRSVYSPPPARRYHRNVERRY